ncbi:MAG: hypothetical protein P1U47_08520 [Zhongshania sp.]|uniref:Uncharacterized protein n=1 Tax=Zhongshania guokunii TaxID=641783 RepID=A0ABV3U4Q3_9GAMM|nr:hypothetical protein [Zhongshania sp.]MDF1692401.1 hypothetical protein [Zhongshania sp.]
MSTDTELDNLLNAYRVAPASAALRQRIVQNASRPSPWAELLAAIGGWRIAGPALAASLMFGVVSQLWWTQSVSHSVAEDSVWTLAMLNTTQEWANE